uniref:Inosine/uridine-preferring nucleoside hydrolase domain-containing protein n=1 Tax=Oncorhynchus kisutch TaxID=8019 RepID=A0A8C7D7Q7_ONCKI
MSGLTLCCFCLGVPGPVDQPGPCSEKLKGLFIMGGNTDSRGNTTVCAEFNFAADIVLNRFFCPTYIATWEFCCENKLPWSFCDNWQAQDSDKARFMKSIFKHTMNTVATCAHYQREMTAGPGFVSCDSYAMVAAINDGFVWVSEPVAVTVELQGTYTQGMMVLDKLGVLEKEHSGPGELGLPEVIRELHLYRCQLFIFTKL